MTSVAIAGGAGDDTLTVSTVGGSLPVPVAFDGGAGDDTVGGPTSNTTWTVTGSGSGSVGGVTFSGVDTLRGSGDNEDTFVFDQGGAIGGFIDGGAGGFDSLVVGGYRGSVVSRPIDAHSGTLIVDGVAIRYLGLEPITLSGIGCAHDSGRWHRQRDRRPHEWIGPVEITSPTAESHAFSAIGVSLAHDRRWRR